MISPLVPELAEQFGVDPDLDGILVNNVAPGSPAEKAGLKPGDILVGFKGKAVESVPAFRLEVSTSPIDESYELTYIREGQERTAEITLADAEDVEVPSIAAEPRPRRQREAPGVELDRFGLAVQDLTPDFAEQLGFDEGVEGVLVRRVAPESPAASQGIEEGDLITKVVKDKKLQDVSDIESFESLVGDNDDIAVYVQSADGLSRFVGLKAESDEEDDDDRD